MKYIKIVIIILLIVILIQSIALKYFIKKNVESEQITEFISYNLGTYIIKNKNNESVIWAWFKEDDTLFQCNINNGNGQFTSIIFDENISSIFIKDDSIPMQSMQYINLSDEIFIDRQETIENISRHSQVLKNGNIQQRKWSLDKDKGEIELPMGGEWKIFPPYFE